MKAARALVAAYGDYIIQQEDGKRNYPEFEPLYRAHYAEMCERLAGDGIDMPPYNPRLDRYFEANEGGWLLHYTVRLNEEAVGYSNIWLTQDAHNQQLIAKEDTIYVRPDHRKGVGKALVRTILGDLKGRGVKRVLISPVTDLRVGKIWQRMGFKPVAEIMQYSFEEEA